MFKMKIVCLWISIFSITLCSFSLCKNALASLLCIAVDPPNAQGGTTLDVTIIVQEHIFNEAPTVTFGCTGITVNNVTVINDREIVANITISESAEDCTGDVTVSTDSKTVICTNGFRVFKAVCSLTEIVPDTVRTGLFLPCLRIVTISGSASNFNNSSEIIFNGPQQNAIKVLYSFAKDTLQLKALILISPRIESGEYELIVNTADESCTGVSLTVE